MLAPGHVRLENALFAPLVIDGAAVGVLGLGNKPGGFTDQDATLAVTFGELVAIALRNSRTLESLRELNAALERKVAERTAELEHRARQLQKLTFELSQAQEREGKRVAEILHEDLQQQIAGAKFQLNLLSSRSQDDPSRQLTAAQINQILKDAIGMSAQPVTRAQSGGVLRQRFGRGPRMAGRTGGNQARCGGLRQGLR